MPSLKELLLGDDEPMITEAVRLSEDSVDAQIDSILMGYQGGATQQEESIDGKLNRHFRLLLEQPPEGEEDEEDAPPEGEEDAPEEEDPTAEPESDQTVGDEEVAADEPAAPQVDKIDIDQFSQKVYNLLTNFQSLLNIEPVIINRAKNILVQNGYDQNTINEFEEILDRQFGVSLEGEREVPERPFGGSAGPIA